MSVLIYGVAFYPLFACLAMATVLGYAVGSLYVWMLTVVDIYQLTECDKTTEERVILVFSSLPQVLCQLYLSVSIPARIPRAIREGRLYVAQTKKPDSSVDDVCRAYIGRHVTKLLKKSETESNMASSHSMLQTVRSLFVRTTHRWRYRWRHGFRYPTRFLSVMFVSMVVVYATTVAFFSLITPINDVIDEYQACLDNALCPNRAVATSLIELLKVTKTSAIISLLVAFLMSLVNVLHMITSFRKNLHDLYQGEHSNIPHCSESKNSILCVGFMKYGGFQVAYIVVGFATQAVLLFLLILVIGYIIAAKPSLLRHWLQVIGPWLVVFVVGLISQRLLAVFVFLQDRAAFLALDNRGCFFVFTYFLFFLNMFIGIVSVLVRMLKSMLFGTLILPRLDYSILPRKFEAFDPGYRAYLGYLQMEYAHTHPVLLVFTRLLLLHSPSKPRANIGDGFVDLETAVGGSRRGPPRSSIARRKWHVAYTLLRNPDLLYLRKVFNQSNRSRALAARGALETDIEFTVQA
ncbi:hypothetical protein V1264_010750 [Littorina saxatilis]|uniref:Receptor for retinol uptake STRA6 n=2 Tax=Littorina saxatilis TaxID=31220 RepID=A0AAN9AQ83_9CAEN